MLRPVANTWNPASSRLAAMPRPTPRLAPVTSAALIVGSSVCDVSRSMYTAGERRDGFVCLLRLVVQNQCASIGNRQQMDPRVYGKHIPGVLKAILVKTICGLGQKLLVETRPQREQGNVDLVQFAGVIGGHELAKVADLNRQRHGLHLPSRPLAAIRVVGKHLHRVIVALPGVRRYV